MMLVTFVVLVEIPIRISAAAQDDFAWCAALMASSDPWITLGRGPDLCLAALNRPGTDLFVARKVEDDRPVGFILVSAYGLAGSPYIASIGVAEVLRGQGVGSQMLRFAEQHFAGRAHLFLLVSSFNQKAQKLYQQMGYRCVGELSNYCIPGHAELILHKDLA